MNFIICKFYLKYIYIFIVYLTSAWLTSLGTDSEALLTAQWFLEMYALH